MYLYIIHGEYRPKKEQNNKITSTRDCMFPGWILYSRETSGRHRLNRTINISDVLAPSNQTFKQKSDYELLPHPNLITLSRTSKSQTSATTDTTPSSPTVDPSLLYHHIYFWFFIHTFQLVQQMRQGDLQIFSQRLKARSQREKSLIQDNYVHEN